MTQCNSIRFLGVFSMDHLEPPMIWRHLQSLAIRKNLTEAILWMRLLSSCIYEIMFTDGVREDVLKCMSSRLSPSHFHLRSAQRFLYERLVPRAGEMCSSPEMCVHKPNESSASTENVDHLVVYGGLYPYLGPDQPPHFSLTPA